MAFKINPNPTFKASVEIPVPGGKSGTIKFEFRYKDVEQLLDWIARLKELGDVAAVFEIVEGWTDVDMEYSREALEKLIANYHGSALLIMEAYSAELTKSRRKN